jgi:phosphoribosylformylglycinamidine synthase
VNAIKGMSAACTKLDTPVTGGNVSFYNQSEDGPVYPTPTIGMVGVLDSLKQKMTLNFKKPGDVIYVIGTVNNDINCSEYLSNICDIKYSPAPYFDLEEEYRLQQTIHRLIEAKLINSAHDISEGGLFTCLLESAMSGDLGFSIQTEAGIRKDAFLFGESQSRVIISVQPYLAPLLEAEMKEIPYLKLGTVNATKEINIDNDAWGYIADWRNAYENAIGDMMKQQG